jgi:hypothetical protein
MLIMKLVKKFFVFISSLLAYPFLAVPAYADTNVNPCTNANGISAALCNLGGDNIANTLRNIVVFFIVLAVIIALMYLLYGGVKWITSRGEKTEVEAARNHIMAAIIGLIVVFLAIFIVSVLLAVFGLNFSNLTIPKITP